MKYQSRRPYSNIFRFTGWIVLIILLQVTTVPVFTQSLPTSPDGTNGESAEPGGPRQMDFIPPADAASLAEFAPTRSTERTMTAVTGQTIQSDVSQQLDTLFRFNEDTVGVFVESDTFVEAVEIQFHPKNEVETG